MSLGGGKLGGELLPRHGELRGNGQRIHVSTYLLESLDTTVRPRQLRVTFSQCEHMTSPV